MPNLRDIIVDCFYVMGAVGVALVAAGFVMALLLFATPKLGTPKRGTRRQ